jgi:hypothetical protein
MNTASPFVAVIEQIRAATSAPVQIATDPHVTYSREAHAAWCSPGDCDPKQGWDLETWDVNVGAGGTPLRLVDGVARPTTVPDDAHYSHGYVDRAGRQHWLYVRRAPKSATCPRGHVHAKPATVAA